MIFVNKTFLRGFMKLNKISAFVFAMLILFFSVTSMHVTASAEEPGNPLSLKFSLLSNDGLQVVFANQNDIVTVSFVMERTDANEAYTTNGFQNYINYDLSFFELVEDSIVCYDTGSAVAKPQNSITYGQIIQCQNMSNSYESSFLFCSFQLKVIAESGSGAVRHGEVYAFDTAHKKVSVSEQNFRVVIDDGCTHANKSKIEAKGATCTEDGWLAYYVCDSCGILFDESEEAPIADIPYVKASHTVTEVLSYDEQGHWYECTKCGEFVNYSIHYGGEASCESKAKCTVCAQEYGTVNADNHGGETIVKNEKEALNFTDGYTGDVYCTDCGKIVQMGEIIPAPFTFNVDLAWLTLFFVILTVLIINMLKRR